MSSTPVFQAIGDFFQWTFQFFDIVGDFLNWSFIILGAIGMLYWLRIQHKLNKQAANDPNQIK